MFAVTLYDAVYLYLKIASGVLDQFGTGGGDPKIKSGTYMYQRAKNYKTPSSEHCCFVVPC